MEVTDGLRNMSKNLSTAVVNVSDKFQLSLNCIISINLQAGRRLKMK